MTEQTPESPQPDWNVLALMTELYTLDALLAGGCLNVAGLQYGYRFCTRPDNLLVGINITIVRERVLAAFVAALSAETGMPESYWTDRLVVDVPDDTSSLGDLP